MQHIAHYASPLGGITLSAHDGALTGLWFDGQKYDRLGLPAELVEAPDLPIFEQARVWLDAYFAGRDPGALPSCAPVGTPFQMRVWKKLGDIPYGELTSYGAIAKAIEEETGHRSAARAVGGAVGHNPVSIILPCHRVVGASGSLTGYAGGLERKIALLELEGFDMARFQVPTRGTAL